MIHRHPHIYGDIEVADEAEVKANWEKLKLKEGKTSVLEGVPKSLPAMVNLFEFKKKLVVLVLIGTIDSKCGIR